MGTKTANVWALCVLLAASWLAVGGTSSLAQPAEAAADAQQQPATDTAPEAAAPAARSDSAPTRSAKPAAPNAGAESPVNFTFQVQPILDTHCVKCHDAEKHSGGLRLDSREEAARGGDTGKPILGGSLQSNELWARVSSDVAAYRMPKNAAPLSADQIDVLRRWIEQGSHWPNPPQKPAGFFDRAWVKSLVELADRYQFEYRYVLPWAIAYLGVMFALLVILRARAAQAAGRGWASGRMGQWCAGVTGGRLLLVMLVASLGMVLAFSRGHVLNLREQLAKALVIHKKHTSVWSNTVYGYPPKPTRSPGPKHVSGTYYRGNCERNDNLFNRGNYLTCTFHVGLCDRAHQPLHVGDAVPPDGLFISYEIERAPGTTDLLYSPEGMAAVFLLDRFVERREDRAGANPTRLEVLEPGQRWVAYVPIKINATAANTSGTIWVYTGRVTDTQIDGTAHYGIGYNLTIIDGKLAPECDLWMDSFGNPVFEPPAKGPRLPYVEWFGEQPQPTIVGPNTTDPKLLGVDEHVRSGLIKPPVETPAETPVESAPVAAPAETGEQPPAETDTPGVD